MKLIRSCIVAVLFAFILNAEANEKRPGWRLGAGLSPYHFQLKQEGELGEDTYSSTVLSSYRFLIQKQNTGWIWNNELNLSFLNFTNGSKETIPLYDFHTGFQWNGIIGGFESSKNILLNDTGDSIKPRDVRGQWLALGYRYTPKDEYWRAFAKLSLLLDSSVSGESVSTLSGQRLIVGFEQIGVFRGFFLEKYSWTLMPYLDLKTWDIKLKNGASADLQFFEYGLVAGINRLF